MPGVPMAQAQIAQTVVQATPDAENAVPGGVSQLPWAYRIMKSEMLLGCARQRIFGVSAEE